MAWTEQRIQVALLGLAALVAFVLVGLRMQDAVLWNGSPSIPVGFYVRTDTPLELGALVTVRARDVALDYSGQRDFIGDGDRFIKRVAAISGDTVCAEGEHVTINRGPALTRAARDSTGRTLPSWSGCRTLRDEVFLLGDTPDSFDGRYWGPTPISVIEGVWRPL